MRIGIATGGGDAPGLNAAVRAITVAAHKFDWEVYGFLRGWLGPYIGDYMVLTPEKVADIHLECGSILGCSRFNPYGKMATKRAKT